MVHRSFLHAIFKLEKVSRFDFGGLDPLPCVHTFTSYVRRLTLGRSCKVNLAYCIEKLMYSLIMSFDFTFVQPDVFSLLIPNIHLLFYGVFLSLLYL